MRESMNHISFGERTDFINLPKVIDIRDIGKFLDVKHPCSTFLARDGQKEVFQRSFIFSNNSCLPPLTGMDGSNDTEILEVMTTAYKEHMPATTVEEKAAVNAAKEAKKEQTKRERRLQIRQCRTPSPPEEELTPLTPLTPLTTPSPYGLSRSL